MPRKKVASSALGFSAFKTKNTVERLNSKVKNNKKAKKKLFRGSQAWSKLRVMYFENKMQQTVDA